MSIHLDVGYQPGTCDFFTSCEPVEDRLAGRFLGEEKTGSGWRVRWHWLDNAYFGYVHVELFNPAGARVAQAVTQP